MINTLFLTAIFRETSAKEQIELQRIRTLLDNEKSKLEELEQCRNATQKSGESCVI